VTGELRVEDAAEVGAADVAGELDRGVEELPAAGDAVGVLAGDIGLLGEAERDVAEDVVLLEEPRGHVGVEVLRVQRGELDEVVSRLLGGRDGSPRLLRRPAADPAQRVDPDEVRRH
jgi:hypothetical protein